MNLRRKTTAITTIAATMAAVGLGAFGLAAPASAATEYTHHYCDWGSAWENWDGQKANTCQGVYEITRGTDANPKVVFKINHANTTQWKVIGKAVGDGYEAAQKWCGENSLTCGIITAVGVTYAFSVIAA